MGRAVGTTVFRPRPDDNAPAWTAQSLLLSDNCRQSSGASSDVTHPWDVHLQNWQVLHGFPLPSIHLRDGFMTTCAIVASYATKPAFYISKQTKPHTFVYSLAFIIRWRIRTVSHFYAYASCTRHNVIVSYHHISTAKKIVKKTHIVP